MLHPAARLQVGLLVYMAVSDSSNILYRLLLKVALEETTKTTADIHTVTA